VSVLTICFALCSIVGFANLYRLWQDKMVHGVSYFPSVIYAGTNAFEVWYFSSRGDWMTAIGAALMFTGTFSWLALALFYRQRLANLRERTGGLCR
jgi:hypothetical protein